MIAVCKYAPLELVASFGIPCESRLEAPGESVDAGVIGHENLCGFGKALLAAAMTQADGTSDEHSAKPDLVLTDCCDVTRRVFDVMAKLDERDGTRRFLHLMGLPHSCGPCQVDMLAFELERLCKALEEHHGRPFDLQACQRACREVASNAGIGEDAPYIAALGVRASDSLVQLAASCLKMPVRDFTCMGLRSLDVDEESLLTDDREAFFRGYARALLDQVPCMRMAQTGSRRALLEDPNLAGVIYHTVSFCDFYGHEAFELQQQHGVPVLSLETDYTVRGAGQLRTRLEAFAETIGTKMSDMESNESAQADESRDDLLFVGIDSGSTSTDVVVIDATGDIMSQRIIPTGGSAVDTGRECLEEALADLSVPPSRVAKVVATGYGREYLDDSDEAVTEITCHARGARALFPGVRTIIDIGGQDSKVITLNEDGSVANFVMNDKCAAGTGRFLEMMASTLQVSLEELAQAGLEWDEEIVISSMCSVFAESEVVSLKAQSKALPDIIHGLNDSIAKRTAALVKRVDGQAPFFMTGGVALNQGVVAAIEKRLGAKVAVSGDSQIAGALGAALIACETY